MGERYTSLDVLRKVLSNIASPDDLTEVIKIAHMAAQQLNGGMAAIGAGL
jgi:hypothetical protein